MNWQYTYTPNIWLSFGIFLFFLLLAAYCWRRHSVPGAMPLMIGCLFGAAISAGSVLEYAAVDEATKIYWYKFQVAFMLPVVTALFCFLLEFAWPGRWLNRNNMILLSVVPVAALGLFVTNDLHHLVWLSIQANDTVHVELGPGGWLAVVYSFLILGAINLFVFGWLFLHSPQHRWPIALMLVGQLGGHLLWILSKTHFFHTILPIALIAIAFEFFMYTLAFFGFRILDPIPIARNMVIEQLQAGILVLDPQGRIVSLNPAAERIFEAPASQVKGRLIHEMLPAYSDRLMAGSGGTEIEIDLKSGQEIHHYTLAISQLKDWRGLDIGRLLMLHDITGQKRAQAQLVDHQRALAMLHERERLARELHDSLGQALAATYLQASTAKLLFARGEAAQMSECLDILADTTLQAETDMREFLLGAQSIVSADHSFFATLREYLKHFTRQYNLPVELSVLPELEGQDLPQTVAIQLLRIIQEALSNVRRHARATSAWLTFTVTSDLLQIAICDNGQGFEPTAVAAEQAGGYGLRSMSERSEELGGCLRVVSHPGQGTQVIVKVPVTRER